MRWIGAALAVIAVLYGGTCALMFLEQRALIYHPTEARDLPQAQRIDLKANGETLRIWARPFGGPKALIYFGGNAEDVAKNFDPFAAAMPDRAIYLVNYRGYGGSTGSPSESGLFADALAEFDEVRRAHADVAVVGRSLGTGVAVYAAQMRPVGRLVLVTPYDSIENIAKDRYPLLPVGLVLEDRFDSASRVSGVRAPTLALLAEIDSVIPPARSSALLALFPTGRLRIETIPGSTHNSIAGTTGYARRIAEFLR